MYIVPRHPADAKFAHWSNGSLAFGRNGLPLLRPTFTRPRQAAFPQFGREITRCFPAGGSSPVYPNLWPQTHFSRLTVCLFTSWFTAEVTTSKDRGLKLWGGGVTSYPSPAAAAWDHRMDSCWGCRWNWHWSDSLICARVFIGLRLVSHWLDWEWARCQRARQ